MSDSSESKYYADGDTLTVKRGKFANKTGTVLAKNLDGRYVVKLDDGNVTLVEPHNTKEPAEKTITEAQLVEALQGAAGDGEIFAGDLFANLEKTFPGIREKVGTLAPPSV